MRCYHSNTRTVLGERPYCPDGGRPPAVGRANGGGLPLRPRGGDSLHQSVVFQRLEAASEAQGGGTVSTSLLCFRGWRLPLRPSGDSLHQSVVFQRLEAASEAQWGQSPPVCCVSEAGGCL
ncbi:unnamed protein product [Arctogadus glacialis]